MDTFAAPESDRLLELSLELAKGAFRDVVRIIDLRMVEEQQVIGGEFTHPFEKIVAVRIILLRSGPCHCGGWSKYSFWSTLRMRWYCFSISRIRSSENFRSLVFASPFLIVLIRTKINNQNRRVER